VEKNVLNYVNSNLQFNTLDPRQGFNLNMKIKELIQIQETIGFLRDKAASGELQRVIDEYS